MLNYEEFLENEEKIEYEDPATLMKELISKQRRLWKG